MAPNAAKKCPVPASFVEVIELWPTMAALAADIREQPGKVRKWRERNSIPDDYWAKVLAAAVLRGYHEVNSQLLIELAQRKAA